MPRRKSSRSLWTETIKSGISTSRSPVSTPAQTRAASRPFTGRVLGIDPSLRGTGLAVVDVKAAFQTTLLQSKTIRIKPSVPVQHALATIASALEEILLTNPDAVAIEQSIYVQNFQTAMMLGSVRGAILTMVARNSVEPFDYAPLRIKQAVTGLGRATKPQVAAAVRQHLGIAESLPADEADAAAVALCHAFTWRRMQIS